MAQAPVSPTPVQPAARWPWVLFAACALFSVVAPMCTRDQAVPETTVDAVARELSSLPPRTFVLVHPPWRRDVADALAGKLPAVEVGPALPPDAMDGKRPVVGVLVPHAWGPGALSRLPVDGERTVEGLTLRFLAGAGRAVAPSPVAESPSTPGRWNLPAALPHAAVGVSGGQQVACNAWDANLQRWSCPGMNEWNFVGLRTLPVEGMARTCLWAHPVTGSTLNIAFPGVPLGKTLVVGHALADSAAGNPNGQPVDVLVTVGETRAQLQHPNVVGWKEDRVATTPGAGDVELHITTPHDGARHFCLWLAVEP